MARKRQCLKVTLRPDPTAGTEKHLDLEDLVGPRIDSGLRQMLEQFRYAGLVSIMEDSPSGYVFLLFPPHGYNNEVWIRHNLKRMRSFSYKVEAVDDPRR